MSFEVNWDEIRTPSNLEFLRKTLNERLENIPTHGIFDQLTLQELWLGDKSPDFVLEDIQDGPTPEDTRLVLRIRYASPLKAILKGDLVVNYPSPRFAILPIRICIKQVNVDGKVCKRLFNNSGVLFVDQIGSKVRISLRKEKEGGFTFEFDSEIGDPSRHSKRGGKN